MDGQAERAGAVTGAAVGATTGKVHGAVYLPFHVGNGGGPNGYPLWAVVLHDAAGAVAQGAGCATGIAFEALGECVAPECPAFFAGHGFETLHECRVFRFALWGVVDRPNVQAVGVELVFVQELVNGSLRGWGGYDAYLAVGQDVFLREIDGQIVGALIVEQETLGIGRGEAECGAAGVGFCALFVAYEAGNAAGGECGGGFLFPIAVHALVSSLGVAGNCGSVVWAMVLYSE